MVPQFFTVNRFCMVTMAAENLKSILTNGLQASSNGALGAGLYFTPSPLYAQLYSSSSYHNKMMVWHVDNKVYYVDVLLLIRFPDLAKYGAEIEEISATIGAEYCIHKLFKGAKTNPPIENQMIGCIPPEHADKVVIQGAIVKLHTTNPYEPGGEWYRIKDLVKNY